MPDPSKASTVELKGCRQTTSVSTDGELFVGLYLECGPTSFSGGGGSEDGVNAMLSIPTFEEGWLDKPSARSKSVL